MPKIWPIHVRLTFVQAGAQAIPFEAARFDLALMATALADVNRVLQPTGLLYVSEPVLAGALNDIMRLFHDEEQARAAAVCALRFSHGAARRRPMTAHAGQLAKKNTVTQAGFH